MCSALVREVGPGRENAIRRLLYDLFRPLGYYGEFWGERWSADLQERRVCRSTALLFLAEIMEP